MGAYLSEPITEKISSDQVGKNVACGASSMQGWRMRQEDAHNCCMDFDDDVSLFAVYDGHGGHEVAAYCANNLPEFIKKTEAYKKGDIRQALIDAFLGFDATLATPEIIIILKEIAGSKLSESENGEDSDVEENINSLCQEASMPLDEVMAKYQGEGPAPNSKTVKNKNSASQSHSTNPYFALYRRCRRLKDKGACSSSGAGCSTSSSSWNTNEADVSSSSQPCELSSSTANRKTGKTAGNSEADQILDSTTSNGDVPRMSQVGSSIDSEPPKSSEMPDSSEDVSDTVSPSKTRDTATTQNEAETNGENLVKNFGDADSSKTTADSSKTTADSSKTSADNECSSSCTPLENGEAEQQEKISSSGRRRPHLVKFYKTLLNEGEDNSNDDDDDDDDENDTTFDGLRESDDDDDDNDGDDGDVDNDGSTEEEDDDDDDDEDDDEDDEDDTCMDMKEEPGSDSGCTAVVAILKGNELYVANAGDSRCVLCRAGEAVELSFDHKPEDQPEMERIEKAGGKVTADGRVNGGLNLSRALGDHAYKKNTDLPPEEQMISALPDIKTITLDLEKDEFMVLACDGIWNFMSSQNVINFIRTRLNQGYENISKICEELFDHCLAPNTFGDGTGCDNMTAIIVQFKSSKAAKECATAEVTTVTKKRPVSPNASAEGNTDCTNDEKVIEECKRFKTETC